MASPREVAFADGMKLGDLRNDHLDLIWALNPVTCVSESQAEGGGWCRDTAGEP